MCFFSSYLYFYYFPQIVYILQNGLQIIVIYIQSFIPLSPSLGMKSNQFRSSFDSSEDHISFIELNKNPLPLYCNCTPLFESVFHKRQMQNQIKVTLSRWNSQSQCDSHFTGHHTLLPRINPHPIHTRTLCNFWIKYHLLISKIFAVSCTPSCSSSSLAHLFIY